MFGILALTMNGNQFFCIIDKKKLPQFQIPELPGSVSTNDKISPSIFVYSRKNKFYLSIKHKDWTPFYECEVLETTIPKSIQEALRCQTRQEVMTYITNTLPDTPKKGVQFLTDERKIGGGRIPKSKLRTDELRFYQEKYLPGLVSKVYPCYELPDRASILLGHSNLEKINYETGAYLKAPIFFVYFEVYDMIKNGFLSLPRIVCSLIFKDMAFAAQKPELIISQVKRKKSIPIEFWGNANPEFKKDMLGYVDARDRFFKESFKQGLLNRKKSNLNPIRHLYVIAAFIDRLIGGSDQSAYFLMGYYNFNSEPSSILPANPNIKYIKNADLNQRYDNIVQMVLHPYRNISMFVFLILFFLCTDIDILPSLVIAIFSAGIISSALGSDLKSDPDFESHINYDDLFEQTVLGLK